ncbi:MAG: DinB family protein [Alphaproteobacteria bacterium]|nr:DinB family protein [Alphaproteobacteria bacterium]
MNKLFCVQAQNNAWANLRLGKACLSLDADELSKKRVGFFPTFIETLNHILIVDWFYVSALEGDCMGYSAFEKSLPFQDMTQLYDEQRKIDTRLIDACDNLGNLDGSHSIQIVRDDAIQSERFDRVFLHLIQHQIHHRGQAHCMLSGTKVTPPQLDEFYLTGDDKHLRSADLLELGTSEEKVWSEF